MNSIDAALYYAKGLVVWKSPVPEKLENGTRFTVGFPVCTASEYIGEDGATAVAEMLCLGEKSQTTPPIQNAPGGEAQSDALQIEGRFESGSLTEAGWTAPYLAASKPAASERSEELPRLHVVGGSSDNLSEFCGETHEKDIGQDAFDRLLVKGTDNDEAITSADVVKIDAAIGAQDAGERISANVLSKINFQNFSHQSASYCAAKRAFSEYFVRNYPGPDTIIFDPKWHAPKLFSAAVHAIRAALATATEGSGDGE